MPSGYHVLPLIYDRWQQTYGKDYSTIILPRLLRSITRQNIPTSSMLDVACGTGTLALMMARRGWKVWGVDGSGNMVARAMKKIEGKRLPLLFLHQDMREIVLPERVDLAVSLFDSLNHLTSRRDLLQTFRRVNRALVPGGYFMFDLNNERCFRLLWTRTESVDADGFTLILQNRYDRTRRNAYSFVSLFLREGDTYRRSGEIVRERYYPRTEVRELLNQADFRVLECADFNFTDVPEVGKIKTWWVVRKKGRRRGG